MLNMLSCYFYDRKFKVKNGAFTSELFDIKAGAPAGNSSSSLIFTLYINDIFEALDLPFVLYADDLVFYADATNFEKGMEEIQKNYKKLGIWCKENSLKINASKTKVMLFHKAHDHRSGKLLKGNILLNGDVIEVTSSFKYLGVMLDPTLSFMDHFDKVETKLNGALSKLYAIKRYMTERSLKTIISSYVISIYEYCIVIWAVQPEAALLKLQGKIDRFLFNFYYPILAKKKKKGKKIIKIDNNQLLDKVGIHTVSERRSYLQVKFIIRHISSGLFEGWFKKSSVGDDKTIVGRLIVENNKKEVVKDQSKSKDSKQYNDSVKWACISAFNKFVEKCKPTVTTTMGQFLIMCENRIKKSRLSNYVT